ncbi:hypothetical protein LDENG_00127710 [Lucifuga dentata]|nr:hypothetical protein LDENG_00127710 [Lucifuga dentata]
MAAVRRSYHFLTSNTLVSENTATQCWRNQTTLRKEEMLLSERLVLSLCMLLVCSVLTECEVFLDQSSAGQLLHSSRRRRANFLLEEIKPGNLERECYEEICSQEEAAEIFQTQEKTLEFWFRYTNLNPCRTNPCLNGGFCTLDKGDFLCLCPPQYHGKTCNSGNVTQVVRIRI